MNSKLLAGVIIAVVACLLIAVVVLGGFLNGGGNPPPGPGGNDVEMKGFAFSPAELTIGAGESVTWTNQDSAPHDVVSDSGTEISSPTLSKGQTYNHVFNQTGTYDYHCGLHPSMKGKIIVV